MTQINKKTLVVSAVNLNEGGPLTVLIESLDAASQFFNSDWEIIVLVHKSSLVLNPRFKILEFPNIKRSWLYRLYFEWIICTDLSRKLKVDLWVSLHDITPRVLARRQIVYCHNPSPFYKMSWREVFLEPKLLLFNKFYSLLYSIFINRNHTVIVQQSWLRNEFQRRFGHPNIAVAYPSQLKCTTDQKKNYPIKKNFSIKKPLIILYPAFPRVFKNIEVLCEAMQLLPLTLKGTIELRLTLSGSENNYARNLFRRFSSVGGVNFIGRQSLDDMSIQYKNCDLVLFPSKLETWGLPISEAKSRHLPLFVSEAPYARETVGTYEFASFLPADDALAWANAISDFAKGEWHFSIYTVEQPVPPFAANWFNFWQLASEDL